MSVLGMVVAGQQLTSVVRGATGEIEASNLVELTDTDPIAVARVVEELVASVPVGVSASVVACADADLQARLDEVFAFRADGPEWHADITVTDLPQALAETLRITPTPVPDAPVAVVYLDPDGAPAAGWSMAAVEPADAEVIGASEFTGGRPDPLTEQAGVASLVEAIRSAPAGGSIGSVLLTGPGAVYAGADAQIAGLLGVPVGTAELPEFATAVGAAAIALPAETTGPVAAGPGTAPTEAVVAGSTSVTQPIATAVAADRRRWWLIGGVLGAALLLLGVAVGLSVALSGSTDGDPEPVVVPTTSEPSRTPTTTRSTPTTTTPPAVVPAPPPAPAPPPVTTTVPPPPPPPVTTTTTESPPPPEPSDPPEPTDPSEPPEPTETTPTEGETIPPTDDSDTGDGTDEGTGDGPDGTGDETGA